MAPTRSSSSKSCSSATAPPGILKLPTELHEHICIYVFSSIRLTFGERLYLDEAAWLDKDEDIWIRAITKPKSSSFALLHTCRQLRAVATSLWLKHVLFNFDSAMSMLRALGSAPESMPIKGIRHVRVAADASVSPPTKQLKKPRKGPLPSSKASHYLWPPTSADKLTLHQTLVLLPDLQPDILTVLVRDGKDSALTNLAQLIHFGHGWNELRIVCPSRRGLISWMSARDFKESTGIDWTWPDAVDAFIPVLHPAGCKDMLLKRDGSDSGASLEMFTAKHHDQPPGSIDLEDPDKYEPYELRTPIKTNDHVRAYVNTEITRAIVEQGGIEREVLLIAKCGTASENEKVLKKASSATINARSLLRRRGWETFRKQHIAHLFPKADAKEVRFDQYENRDFIFYEERNDRWNV